MDGVFATRREGIITTPYALRGPSHLLRPACLYRQGDRDDLRHHLLPANGSRALCEGALCASSVILLGLTQLKWY